MKGIPDEQLQDRVAEAVRKRSQEGRLSGVEDLLPILSAKVNSPEQTFETLMEQTSIRSEDLRVMAGPTGRARYYSTIYMSDTYARLLIRREGDPLLMIAETIRENSQVYPRPVRKDTFNKPPFDLTEEEISACLEKISQDEQYKDISQTTTSEGNVFFYSTLHLDPDHASMLAEWVDVGQYRNP